jgi:MFS family permease
MGSYTAVLKRPGVLRILLSQLAARWAFGMMSLAFVLHVQRVTGSYALAGITLGAETLGAAIAGPMLGRLIPRIGVRPVVFTTATIGAAAMVLIGLSDGSLPVVLICLGFAVGITSPPIQQIVRPIYPSLISKEQTNHLFALDANLQELIWVVGPILATFIAANAGTPSALFAMAGVQLVGCYLFASNHEVRNAKMEPSKRRMGGVLKSRVVLSNVAMGMLMVATFGGAEVGTVAVITDRNVSGIVLAALSAGSLIGGFAFGHRAKTKYALSKFFALTLLGYSLIFIAPHEAIWVAICWFIAGLGVAPIFANLASIIAIKLSAGESVEAYGWISTGQLIGYSSAAAIAGIAVDTIDPIAAFGVSIGAGLLGLVVALISLPFTPTPPSTDKADH